MVDQVSPAMVIFSPVEPGRIRFINSVIGKKNGRPDAEVIAELQSQMDEQAKVVEQDFPIWENKVFQENPVLCKDDGPLHQFRDWARKFYTHPVKESA